MTKKNKIVPVRPFASIIEREPFIADLDDLPRQDRIGPMLRGQYWVELHGQFTISQLRELIRKLEEGCKGLEPKNGTK